MYTKKSNARVPFDVALWDLSLFFSDDSNRVWDLYEVPVNFPSKIKIEV